MGEKDFEGYKEKISGKTKEYLTQVTSEEKALSRLEERAFEIDAEKKKAEIAGLKQNIEERRKFAQWIFWMVAIWLLIILVIIFLLGFGIIELSDAIVISLLGATTVNVTAFFLAVTRYLFPGNQ